MDIFFRTLFILLCVSTTAVAQNVQPSSIVETYSDWTVRCVPQKDKRLCQLIQELAQSKGGKRIMSLVIDTPLEDAKTVAATILTPFGLKLADGIVLGVDGKQMTENYEFSTCIPLGCIVPVVLDEKLISKFQSGGKLAVTMVSISDNKRVKVELSLGGFTAAYARLKQLAADAK